MIVRLKRNYEVSIWTLQDSFITVLKWFNLENKGQIQNPKMSLNTDGTQDFSFSIPMYITDGAEKKENPIWYNTLNGNLAINMRKIKVIFNKKKKHEKVFEFLITKVIEKHEKGELICEVSCEGLAFHELGKVGYKISLQQEMFEEDYRKWAEGEVEGDEPIANIQYWLNQFLTPYPNNGIIKRNKWYYQIRMNWSSFSYADERDTDKIYEDEYVSAWQLTNNKLVPTAIEALKEKARLVDLTESNMYNLTQELAEKFGVFCRYEYLYDDTYHIIGKLIIFYNNFIEENNGFIDITYPYSTSSITREMDSTELTTKLFIKSIDNENSPSGQISIIDVDANKTGEDYLLNFDYMHLKGIISEEQYQGVEEFESNIAAINNILIPLSEQKLQLENKLPTLTARQTILENSISLDAERIASADDLLNSLTNGTGTIIRDASNPMQAVLLEDNGTYYINIRELGVNKGTIKAYKNYNFSNSTLSQEVNLSTVKFVYDEANNLVKITNISDNNGGIVYLTFEYRPATQYENIQKMWQKKETQDKEALNELQLQINNITTELETIITTYNQKIEEKQQLIIEFEEMMGPALREGYWQADDSDKEYGEKHNIDISSQYIENGYSSDLVDFIWDTVPIDEEQLGYYKYSLLEEQINYPYLILSSDFFTTGHSIIDYFSTGLSFIFNRNGSTINFNNPLNITEIGISNTYVDILALHAGCELAFTKINNVVTPILLLTGVENITLGNEAFAAGSFIIGTTTLNNNNIIIDESWDCTNTTIITNGNGTLVYPRAKIKSGKVKNDANNLFLSYNNNLLSTPQNYYSLLDLHNEGEQIYYITIKPETLINGFYNNNKILNIKYCLSNADVSIYLDAQQVLKENAFPKVSYTVKPNVFEESLIETLYEKLNTIIHINDVDLKFENVLGYISKVDLDLDMPSNDSIEVKNYKTKFEDLFSTIVAQTEQMKKNEATISAAAKALTATGTIAPDVIQDTLYRVDLDYAFNNGKLTINEADGIWATSDSGVVAIRGGGIFTATEQDANGKWLWNTGIVPSGINADLITTGQLDTNLIKIFSGDKIRFQWNGEGLYAYKDNIVANATTLEANVDKTQYVKLCEDGLFLRHDNVQLENNTIVNINRVSISWDGLELRNNQNQPVFYADSQNGNLTIKGALYATELHIGENGNNLLNNQGQIPISLLAFDHLGTSNNSAIYIEPNKVTINSTGNIEINTSNLIINSAATGSSSILELKQKASDWTEQNNHYDTALKYSISNGLEVTGQVHATSFTLGNDNHSLGISDVNGLQTALDNAAASGGFSINGLSNGTRKLTTSGSTMINTVELTSTYGLALGADYGVFILKNNSNALDNTYVSITSGGINFDVDNNTYIHMDQNGIKVKGSNIQMSDPNGEMKNIWSHGNIIVMNSNLTSSDSDYWRHDISSIENTMSGKHDWVLIRPYYDAQIIYYQNNTIYTNTARSGFSVTLPSTDQQQFGDTSSQYIYKLKFNWRTENSNTYNAGQQATITLTSTSGGSSRTLSWQENSLPRIPDIYNSQEVELSHSFGQGSFNNLCQGNANITVQIDIIGMNDTIAFSNIQLQCSCDATTSRVPCTVYYYP